MRRPRWSAGAAAADVGAVCATRFSKAQRSHLHEHEHRDDGRMFAANRTFTQMMPSGRTRCWGWVEEVRHYVRVVILEDGATLHTAMIDSKFKGGSR
jgi:hypothetical protein